MNTVPIMLVGSMAMTLNVAAVPSSPEKPDARPDTGTATDLGKRIGKAIAAAGGVIRPGSLNTASFATAGVPASYTVKAGDTVSGIAGRFGLSTASVLAANGLGWKSVIFPGQVLKLGTATASPAPVSTAPASTAPGGRYTIKRGDTVSRVAARFGLSTQSVLSANGLSPSSIIYPGQTLTIPGAATPTGEPPATTAPATTPAGYTIARGDTISSIAKRFRVSAQALLEANGLNWSSLIYAGRSLRIPAPAAQDGSTVTPMTGQMRENAEVIVRVGRQLGVPDYGLVIALATAMQESGLRNLDYGDRDSIGLFQQRPSAGWGSVDQILDPEYSARLFFGGPANPNAGITRGLLDIPGWDSMPLTKAAQAVQISAFPTAYAKWETSARAWLSELR